MPGQAIVTIRDKQWQAYLATTYAELTTGLRGLPSIAPGTGVLFVLPQNQTVTVTTQGLLFPIDIIFISSQIEVVSVAPGVLPDVLVTESTPARYFLEVNAGEAEGIESGDVASITIDQVVSGTTDWISPVVSFAGVVMAGTFLVNMGKTMAGAVLPQKSPELYVPGRETLLPAAKTGPRPCRDKPEELEFLPDSPEFLAYTIEDIGYRDRIDSAFLQAIARAKEAR